MPINATPIQQVVKYSTGQSISIGAGDGWSAPTVGSLLILACSYRVDATTVNAPTFSSIGFTEIHSDYTQNSIARGSFAWKVADGTETTIAFDGHSSDIFVSWMVSVLEFASTDLDLTGVAASAEAKATGGSTTSHSAGTTTNATANSLCLSMMAITVDNAWNTTGPSINGSYTIVSTDPATGANAAVYVASKVSGSVADQNPTWSTTDSGSTVYAVNAIFSELIQPAVTFDNTTYEAGGTIVVTASPQFAGTITTFGVTGGDSFTVSGASTSAANAAIPAITQFVSGGAANNTRLGTSLTGTVGDGTDTATDTFTLTVPTGYFLVTLAADYAALSTDAKTWVPSTAVTGDDLLVSATVGTINDVTPYGEISWDGIEGTARVVHFVVANTAWSAVTSPTFGPGYAFPSLTTPVPDFAFAPLDPVHINIADYFDGDFAQFSITYSVLSSDSGLPSGLSLDTGTGVISGQIDELEEYPSLYGAIIVRLTDGVETADTNAFSMTVDLETYTYTAGGRPRRGKSDYRSIYPSITEQILAEDSAVLESIKKFVTVH